MALQSWGHVHDEIGSVTFRYWEPMFKRLTDEQIMRALAKAERFTGFLKPGQFEAWAMEVDGVPSLEAAFAECTEWVNTPHRKPLSHPGLLWVIRQTGSYELKTQTRDRVIFRFKGFYEDMVSQVLAGRVFDIPAERQIEHQEAKPAADDSPERQRFQECRRQLRQHNIDHGYKTEPLP